MIRVVFIVLLFVFVVRVGGVVLRRTPLHRTAPNFALFFPSPAPIFSFCLSRCVFSLNFGGVCEVMADFGQTDFGQTDFGQFFDPIVVLTDFGQTDFGQFLVF